METKKTTPKKTTPKKAEEIPQFPSEIENKYEYFYIVRKLGVFYLGVGYKNGRYYVIDLHGNEAPVSDETAEALLRQEDIVYSRGPYDDYFYDPRFDE